MPSRDMPSGSDVITPPEGAPSSDTEAITEEITQTPDTDFTINSDQSSHVTKSMRHPGNGDKTQEYPESKSMGRYPSTERESRSSKGDVATETSSENTPDNSSPNSGGTRDYEELYPSSELTTELYPISELTTELYPSLELTTELYPSLELTTELYPSSQLTTELYPSSELTTELYPSSELTTELYPSTEQTTKFYPSAEQTTELYPRAEQTTELYPSLELIPEQENVSPGTTFDTTPAVTNFVNAPGPRAGLHTSSSPTKQSPSHVPKIVTGVVVSVVLILVVVGACLYWRCKVSSWDDRMIFFCRKWQINVNGADWLRK